MFVADEALVIIGLLTLYLTILIFFAPFIPPLSACFFHRCSWIAPTAIHYCVIYIRRFIAFTFHTRIRHRMYESVFYGHAHIALSSLSFCTIWIPVESRLQSSTAHPYVCASLEADSQAPFSDDNSSDMVSTLRQKHSPPQCIACAYICNMVLRPSSRLVCIDAHGNKYVRTHTRRLPFPLVHLGFYARNHVQTILLCVI
jgi:hypothetical protein